MPEDRLEKVAGAPVVQEEGVAADGLRQADPPQRRGAPFARAGLALGPAVGETLAHVVQQQVGVGPDRLAALLGAGGIGAGDVFRDMTAGRSEEHTSELQSLMRISYAVFCLKKKTITHVHNINKSHLNGETHTHHRETPSRL